MLIQYLVVMPENAKVLKNEVSRKSNSSLAKEVDAISLQNPKPVTTQFTLPSQTSYPPSSFDNVYKQAGSQFGIPWQILYGIHMTETGLRNGPILSGYGTGARGPMQFMPGTFQAYKVDGHPDIDNAVDAIYAAANYLAKHGGWSMGLKTYGGNYKGVLLAARSRGFTP